MADTVQKLDVVEVAPLSDLHKMVGQIRREVHPHEINRIINDPSIYEWVKGHNIGRLDLEPVLASPQNVLLMGQHGGLLFYMHQMGFYEVHTVVLPEGRGAWAKAMAEACLHIMFTQHSALEISTRVPKGNLGARVLTRMCGFEYEFTRSAEQEGWVYKGDPVPADIFSLTIQKWMRGAPGLIERGHWFHDKLEREYRRLGKPDPKPHADDPVHDRYVGAALEMIFGGQHIKGLTFYNRWAAMAGYRPVQPVAPDPLTVDIGEAMLCFRDGDFWVLSCR